MRTLYPAIKPYATRQLKVDDVHDLYVEECGSRDGIPVLFVHGGPGTGCNEQSRRYFDPQKYRIVLFDQRGCGRSTPHAELTQNNTALLVNDIERIREALNIDRWLLFGGSWGSTLSLVYAQAHPKRVAGLILRGVFLSREQDLRWLYTEGASRIFPDHWTHFVELIPEDERGDLLAAYHRRLFGENELARMSAAKHWSMWEGNIATLRPNHELVDEFADPHMALSLSRIECHYFNHNSFLEPDQIIKNMPLISAIPGVIVHGRYDMICPLDNAQVLADHWVGAELKIIRDAGHSACEPGIVDALIRATDDFAQRLAS